MTGRHRLFLPEAVDAETLEFNAGLEARQRDVPPVHERSAADSRRMREAGTWGEIVRSDRAVDRLVSRADGPDVPIRIFEPDTVRGVHVFVHGGGWVLGAADQQDQALEALAAACEMTVVSVEYRLAPEHPFPNGPDDCEAAARWVVEHAEAEFGTDRVTIGGRSAGAHLAVLTLLRLRDRHGITSLRAADLQFGLFDLRMTPSARNWGRRQLVLSTPSIRWHIRQFIGDRDPDDPQISPLLAELGELPPALFTVGTLDPLIDDSIFMAGRWEATGSAAELNVYPGGTHAFTSAPTHLAERARSRTVEFLRSAIEAP